MNARARTTVGLVIGLTMGTLGPLLDAVAWHSGNDSGNDVARGDGAVSLEQAATAAWPLDVNGAPSYFFEVVRETGSAAGAGTLSQDAASSSAGEAVAWIRWCPTCPITATWRATLGGPEDPGLVMDPAGNAAVFDGTLVSEQTGEPCAFHITWTSMRDQDAGASGDLATEGPQIVSLDGEVVLRRPVELARVSAPECWPTEQWLGFGLGRGAMIVTVSGGSVASERAHCLTVPTRGLVCRDH